MRYAIGECVDGRYRIEGVLGQGGFGETYKALNTATGQTVVLKLPDVAIIGDLSAYNRYRREIEIGQCLDHPGLQRVLPDARINGRGDPFMVLEYVHGESLRTYLRAHPPLPVDDVLHITRQLAETLRYVHAQGVVHRDLKPENILITPDGRVKLADFGIALRTASRRLTFNHLSNAVGTPDYMAPEQVRGERGDQRTDVYALGAVLYELLTGRVPYPADEALEAMRRKVQTEPPLVRRARPDVPPQLEAAVYRALRRKPAERYASMAELAHDLAHLETVTIPAYRPDIPPPKPLGDLPPWRTSIPVFLILFAVLAALGFLAQFTHGRPPH
ncbi:MAG TPA: serine/threonine-protein kinase [Chloroflexota bacterium]|nr:serine/threonine-protein kinase [Chloroflexota bacterium]